MADVYVTSTSLQASFIKMVYFDKKIPHAGWVFGTECPVGLAAILIYSHYIQWSKPWTYFKYHQDLSCEYIKMKFRIYLLDSNLFND